LLELAGYLRDRSWESHVVALEGAGAGELVRMAASQGLVAQAFVPAGRLAFLPMASRLRRLLAQYPRAVVHSHGYKPDLLLSWLGMPRRLVCVATCHNWIYNTWKQQLLKALDKRGLRHFDHVAAVSAEIAQELVGAGVPAEKVSVVDNGISVPDAEVDARLRVRMEFGVPTASKLIVHIGRLARPKRIDLLLEAVSTLPQAFQTHVLLVGEGEEREALADLARRAGLEHRVHFCGYRSDVGRMLAAADLFVLSSEKEGLPLVVLEAMAMRCPIVSTRVGAVPNVLSDGHDAWIVPMNDTRALNDAISDVLQRPDVAVTRAAHAYTGFVRRYSRDSMGDRYLQIYEDAWGQRGWPR
jgi:glycosyltransferase involved in cell wall biosynthesis